MIEKIPTRDKKQLLLIDIEKINSPCYKTKFLEEQGVQNINWEIIFKNS